MFRQIQSHIRKNDGQVLFLIVLFITLVMTIVMIASFRVARDTQITQSDESVDVAMEMAQMGAELAMAQGKNEGTFSYESLGVEDLEEFDIASGVVIAEKQSDETFLTRSLDKDEQVTFYLSDYDKNATESAEMFGEAFTGEVELYYQSESQCDDVALELTLFSEAQEGTEEAELAITRYVSDKDGRVSPGTGSERNVYTERAVGSEDFEIDEEEFQCKTEVLSLEESARLLFVRLFLFGEAEVRSSKIAFTIAGGGTELPAQGMIYTSQVELEDGTERTAEAFLQYPQIPADMFVMSF